MLVVDQAKVSFDKLVFDWSFQLPSGKVLAITGKSGVGKSTLLRSLIGLNAIDSGDITWAGESCLHKPIATLPFGMMFQKDNVFEHLTVRQNLAFGLSPSGKLSAKQTVVLEQAAGRFDLTSQLNQMAASLSGGQQQRVALARVFLQNKPVLLLDEPFASLDPMLRKDGLDWVLELQKEQGTTIIMVTHHLEEVADAAQYLYHGSSSNNWQFSEL